MRCNSTGRRSGLKSVKFVKPEWLRLAVAPALLLAAGSAFAHHPMGGQVPATFFQGLASGFGHPIIGLDHFAFLLAVGLVAALHRRPYLLPMAFLAAMVGGVFMHAGRLDLPGVEVAVAASTVLLGMAAIRARALPWAASAGLIAVAGLFHGHAFGEAIVGAEATPLLAYLAGLLMVQLAICASTTWIVRNASGAADYRAPVLTRVAGGVACGVGIVFLAQNLTAAAA